jgi:5-methylcytosine-specific restriction endonuclease McrA
VMTAYYKMPYKNRYKQQEYQRKWVSNRRATWLAENGPCIKCKSWDELEVDHINPLTKVDHRIWSWSLIRRTEELKKCQVLCRGCHLEKSLLDGSHTGYRY